MSAPELLRRAVLDALPRALTLLDRLVLSATRGSFDRAYWHYRTDKGYPSATFQQLAWPLARLWSWRDPANPWQGSELVAEAAAAGLQAWARAQASDGSFSEWYRGEKSHVATAFTTFGACETARLLGDRYAALPARAAIDRALLAAGAWLTRCQDFRVSNHAAGAIAALASLEARFPGRFAGPLAEQVARLAAARTREGWLPEYGGANPGYSSVALAFVELARRALGASELACTLDEVGAGLVGFIAATAGPDGSLGGPWGRRGARYAFLTGLALRAPHDARAARLLADLGTGLERRALPLPGDFDDRYFAFFALPDAAAALAAWPPAADAGSGPLGSDREPGTDTELELLPEAGLAVLRAPRVTILAAADAAGSVAAWHDGRLAYCDAGYAALDARGRRATSERQGGGSRRLIRVGSGFELSWEGRFRLAERPRPYERYGPLLDLGARLLAPLPELARRAGEALKTRFVAAARDAPLRLERRVQASARELRIVNRLTAELSLRALLRTSEPGSLHVPSARQWLPAFVPALPLPQDDLASELAPGHPLVITTVVSLHGDGPELTTELARG